MPSFTFEIVKEFGEIGRPSADGMQKSLNLVSWNNRKEKYDLRPWDETKTRCGKGISFSASELKELRDILNNMEID